MSQIKTIISFIIMGILTSPVLTHTQEFPNREAQAYVFEKLRSHNLVFMGTTHKQPPILTLIANLFPHLHAVGVTHVALEISDDQQKRLDRFLENGRGLYTISLLPALDCPQYRHLLTILSRLDAKQRPRVLAIDLPQVHYGGSASRDEYMAMALAEVFQAQPGARILTILGSMHVLHELRWQNRIANGHHSIRTYLGQLQPSLNMFSIVHIVSRVESTCDFGRRLGPLPGTVAMDLDDRFKDWRLGLTACIAIRPTQADQLVDGVIVY